MTTIGGTSESVFKYRTLTSVTTIPPGVVEVTPQLFTRIVGKQTIIVTDVNTNYSWSIEVDGGFNALSGGYITSFDNSGLFYYRDNGTAMNVQDAYMSEMDPTLQQEQVKVITPVADSGGRTYIFTFSRFVGVQPTILKTAGAAIGGNLTVTVKNVQGLYLYGN